MKLFRLVAIAVTIGVALVACDQGTPRVVSVSNNSDQPSRYLRETAVTGLIRVLIAPNTVAGASGYVNETLAVMEKSVRQDHPIFQAVDKFEVKSGLLVVVFVGAPDGMSGKSLCRGEVDQTSARVKGEVKLIAAMCKRNDIVGEVHGWIDESVAAGDKDYAIVIEQMTLAMFSDSGQRR